MRARTFRTRQRPFHITEPRIHERSCLMVVVVGETSGKQAADARISKRSRGGGAVASARFPSHGRRREAPPDIREGPMPEGRRGVGIPAKMCERDLTRATLHRACDGLPSPRERRTERRRDTRQTGRTRRRTFHRRQASNNGAHGPPGARRRTTTLMSRLAGNSAEQPRS